MIHSNDTKGPFAAAGNLEVPCVPKLRIATDIQLAVVDEGLRVRKYFLKALIQLKLLGHEILFFSKYTDSTGFQDSTRNYVLPDICDDMDLESHHSQRAEILSDAFFWVRNKSEIALSNKRFDIIFSIRPADFNVRTQDVSLIHPGTPLFHAFINAVLLDSHQDIIALVAKLKSSPFAPAPGQ